jgi:hypothetical protein
MSYRHDNGAWLNDFQDAARPPQEFVMEAIDRQSLVQASDNPPLTGALERARGDCRDRESRVDPHPALRSKPAPPKLALAECSFHPPRAGRQRAA